MSHDKSPDAYRTISEAAAESDLPAHVLRFWESKFAQLKPIKRNGGRRLYRPQDVLLLKGLRRLLYDEGFTIKGAQKYLRDHGVAAVATLADGEGEPQLAGGTPAEPGAAKGHPGSAAATDPREADTDHDRLHGADAVSVNAGAQLAGADRVVLERALQRLESARDRLREVLQA